VRNAGRAVRNADPKEKLERPHRPPQRQGACRKSTAGQAQAISTHHPQCCPRQRTPNEALKRNGSDQATRRIRAAIGGGGSPVAWRAQRFLGELRRLLDEMRPQSEEPRGAVAFSRRMRPGTHRLDAPLRGAPHHEGMALNPRYFSVWYRPAARLVQPSSRWGPGQHMSRRPSFGPVHRAAVLGGGVFVSALRGLGFAARRCRRSVKVPVGFHTSE